MKPFVLLAVAALGTFATLPSATGAPWELVWADEFDQPGLPDPARWDYEVGFIRNREAQFYTRARPENARIENGHLVIEARREDWPNPDFQSGAAGPWRRSRASAEFTSASLVTLGKASWTYGRIEVRAQLPSARGTWPAIWMLGTNIREVGWPACGEIDIMEFVGYDPGVVHANIHTKAYNHVQRTAKGARLSLPTASDAFHVYAVEWFPDRLDFYVDDRKFFSFANEGTGSDAWPFHRDHYLILNLAIGGDWGGQRGIDADAFPQRFLIDYVRVYRTSSADSP